MQPTIRNTVMLVVGSLAANPLPAQTRPSIQKAAPIAVSVDDLGERIVLIGRLKKPLGTLMTIRGKWHYPEGVPKDYSLRFTVTHVDGHRLTDPIEFDVAQLEVHTKSGKNAIPPYERRKPLDGVEWTLKAYETGSLHISPPIGPDGSEAAAEQAAYYTRPFTSKVVGVLQP